MLPYLVIDNVTKYLFELRSLMPSIRFTLTIFQWCAK